MPVRMIQKEVQDATFFRADIARGSDSVDRSKGIIYNFAVVTLGPTKDLRGEFDEDSLKKIVKLGNKAKLGIKSRFGHPNMSFTALGTFLGRVKNFNLDDNVVRADLYIDKTAHKTPDGDLATYVMDLAESDPDAFGSSMVIKWDPEFRLEKDGTAKKDKEGNTLIPLIRVKSLMDVDIVDDPAANNGMFGVPFFSASVIPSAEMTSFLDKFLCDESAVEKMISFLGRYSINREEHKNEDRMNAIMEKIDITARTLSKADPGEVFLVLEKALEDYETKGGDKEMSEKVEDVKKKEEVKLEETKNEEVKVEETKTEEVKVEETKTEEVKVEETKTEEVKVEETKNEEVKVEETKTEEVKVEEPKTEEVKLSQEDVDSKVATFKVKKDREIKDLKTKVLLLETKIKGMEADSEVEKLWSDKYADVYSVDDASEVKRILKKSILKENLSTEETEILIDRKISNGIPGNTEIIGGGQLSEERKDELRKIGGIRKTKKN